MALKKKKTTAAKSKTTKATLKKKTIQSKPKTKAVTVLKAKKTVTKPKVAKKKAVKKVSSSKTVTPKKATSKKPTVKKATVRKPISTKKKTVMTKPVKRRPKKTENTTTETFVFAPYTLKKNEDYMGDPQLEHFHTILLNWKTELMEEVDSTVVHMQQDVTTFPDPLDRAALEEGFTLELRTRDRERKLIKKIESSLDLIDAREYGYCLACGSEIGIRRLEARPTADKCIDCKTYEEIKEKQTGN